MNPRTLVTSRNKPFSKTNHLAPLPFPTGRTPVDSPSIIWRKNEVFLDIGCYTVGSAVRVMLPMTLMFPILAYGLKDADLLWLGGIIIGIPTLMLLHGLLHPTPPPVRFNRQRREVCAPRDDDHYWIAPWGCVRSYMEVRPDAIPECRVGHAPYEETQFGSIMTSLRKGDWLDVMHGVFFITFLGTYLAEKLQDMKLCPPPDLPHPDIIEWSRPLPAKEWAKRSPEFEAALAIHEVKPN